MKKIILLFLVTTSVFAQGELAADFSHLIGIKYTLNQQIDELQNFKYEQGNVVGDTTNGAFFSTIDVYRKGTTALVVLSKKISTNSDEFRIIDVLKIMNVPKNAEIRTLGCTRKSGLPDETIIAVVNPATKKQKTSIKQAFVLYDIRFKVINAKGIKCVNYGMN